MVWGLYNDNHGKCQSRFSIHITYPFIFCLFCNTRRGLYLHVKVLRTCPSWEGQRKRWGNQDLAAFLFLCCVLCCWMKIIVLSLQRFYEDRSWLIRGVFELSRENICTASQQKPRRVNVHFLQWRLTPPEKQGNSNCPLDSGMLVTTLMQSILHRVKVENPRWNTAYYLIYIYMHIYVAILQGAAVSRSHNLMAASL